MQEEFKFIKNKNIPEEEIYNFINKSYFSSKGIKIIIGYIEYNFKDLNDTNCIPLLNRFTTILNESKIEISNELYYEIKAKTNLLDNCIALILNNKDNLEKLNESSLDLIEDYYIINEKADYNDQISEIDEDTDDIDTNINIPKSNTLREIENIPLLEDKETYELAKLYRETKEKKYRDKLVVHNMRLILPIASKYSKRNHIDMEDLVLEGSFGLIRAVEDYDPEKAKFSTYAVYWINQKIKRYIMEAGRNIRIPVCKHEKLIKYKKVESMLYDKLGKKPTDDEIAQELDVKVEKIDEYKQLLQPIKSLNDTINNDSDDEVLDFLPSDERSPEQKLIDDNFDELKKAITKLNEDQKNIISLRYGLYDGQPRTLEQVCIELYELGLKKNRISRERARQIEAKALEILYNELSSRKKEIEKAENNDEKKFTEEYLDKRIELLTNLLKTTDKRLLNDVLSNISEYYKTLINQYYDDNYNIINKDKLTYNVKLLIVTKLIPKITYVRDRIISYSVNVSENIVLPTNLYVYFDNRNDYAKTKENVNKCINRLASEDRYILAKYYDIYYDTGGIITTKISEADKIKLHKILKNIEFDMPTIKHKTYKKKKDN